MFRQSIKNARIIITRVMMISAFSMNRQDHIASVSEVTDFVSSARFEPAGASNLLMSLFGTTLLPLSLSGSIVVPNKLLSRFDDPAGSNPVEDTKSVASCLRSPKGSAKHMIRQSIKNARIITNASDAASVAADALAGDVVASPTHHLPLPAANEPVRASADFTAASVAAPPPASSCSC